MASLATAALTAAPLLASSGTTNTPALASSLSRVVDLKELDARCGPFARRSEPYPWPLRPFNRQHPVRGFFGDPRTISIADPLRPPAPGDPGVFNFHNGVDIVGAPGQPVYPVVSGTVVRVSRDELIVHSAGGRRFQYWHLKERARTGEHAVAEQTVLGTIRAVWGHVHLTEIRGGCVVNPLAPGHLTPFRDDLAPRVLAIEAIAPSGQTLNPAQLPGRFQLVARASDQTPLAVPGAWHDLPVAPALVEWRLTTLAGRAVVPRTMVADFRSTIPPDRDFWQVYAAGSHENIVIGFDQHAYRIPGVYLFRLRGLPQPLPPGRYRVEVTVANVRGHRSSAAQDLTILRAAPLLEPLPTVDASGVSCDPTGAVLLRAATCHETPPAPRP